MRKVRFLEKSAKRTVYGKCPVCGKRTRRSRTFTFTFNPRNKKPDGTIRTPSEVQAQAYEAANAWQPDLTHEACKSESCI